jgi:hypothetical protein
MLWRIGEGHFEKLQITYASDKPQEGKTSDLERKASLKYGEQGQAASLTSKDKNCVVPITGRLQAQALSSQYHAHWSFPLLLPFSKQNFKSKFLFV